MFKKIPFRRIFLLALIISLAWAITACNRRDTAVFPTGNQQGVLSKPLFDVVASYPNLFVNLVPKAQVSGYLRPSLAPFSPVSIVDGNPATMWDSGSLGDYKWAYIHLFWSSPVRMRKIRILGSSSFSYSISHHGPGLPNSSDYSPAMGFKEIVPTLTRTRSLFISLSAPPGQHIVVNEIEVLGTDSFPIEIWSPVDYHFDYNPESFSVGEPINFVARLYEPVNNLVWKSSINGVFASDTLTVYDVTHFSPGTHLITLSGIASNGLSVSDIVQVNVVGEVASASPKISKIEFSGTALNKIYDRKNHKPLDPPHWTATMQSGQASETQNSSFSYVINSPFSLKPEFVLEDGVTPPNFNFDIELTGKVKDLIGAEPERTITFHTKPGSPIELVSNEVLAEKVGIWGLELNWVFKKNGTQIGDQRTPKANAYHCVLTTWKKPLANQSYGNVAADPTTYLEIHTLSCQVLNGFNSGKTVDEVMSKLLNDYSTTGGFGYSTRVASPTDSRGLDAILSQTTIPKVGWCGELALLLKALIETHGVDVKVRKYELKRVYYHNSALVTSHLAADNISPWEHANYWFFREHATVITKTNPLIALDPTFKEIDSFITYVNSLFDVYKKTGEFISNDPIPDYVGFQVPSPPSFKDYD